jgi:hypothetical protein
MISHRRPHDHRRDSDAKMSARHPVIRRGKTLRRTRRQAPNEYKARHGNPNAPTSISGIKKPARISLLQAVMGNTEFFVAIANHQDSNKKDGTPRVFTWDSYARRIQCGGPPMIHAD